MGNLRRVVVRLCTAALWLTGADAQRPAGTSICDYYTEALLANNTAANQKVLLTLLVNTAVIGNYTKPNLVAVPGILSTGTYNGVAVNLAPYFSGALSSTNRGGASGVAVNFLDDGGAAPLLMNQPASGTSSNQYMLLSHLYEYFGILLGCSQQGTSNYPAYAGSASQYDVHKFMDLSAAQVGYFITQVALSAASFGFASSDLQVVGTALQSVFGYRCATAATVVTAQGPQLQSICTDPNTCPLAPSPSCPNINIAAPSSASPGGDSTSAILATSSTTRTTSLGISTLGTSSTTGTTPSGTGASPTPAYTSGNPPPSSPNALAIGLGVSLGVVLVLCVCGGIWFFLRRRRRRGMENAPVPEHTKLELDGMVAAPAKSGVLGETEHEMPGGDGIRHELTPHGMPGGDDIRHELTPHGMPGGDYIRHELEAPSGRQFELDAHRRGG